MRPFVAYLNFAAAVLVGCTGATATSAPPATIATAGPTAPGPTQTNEATGAVATPGIDPGALSGRIVFMRGDPAEGQDVEPDGSSPHPFEMTPPCGGSFLDTSSAGCYSPEWSPDGSMIVFTRSSFDGTTENIYIIRIDGTGLTQVTNGGSDDSPDWGAPSGDP